MCLCRVTHKVCDVCLKGCNGDEREMGKALADTISRREKRVTAEGQEPDDFWLNLGGRSQYPNSKRYRRHLPRGTPLSLLLGLIGSHL